MSDKEIRYNPGDIGYIAGLFDGEGILTYKKYKEKKAKGIYDCWRISMEISMTDQNVIEIVHEILMIGTVRPKKVPTGMKPQWRWRYAHVKLHKIEQVIDHYEPNLQHIGDNIVNLSLERELRK